MTEASPDFWTMGGYGAYVWSAYGLTAVVAALAVVSAVRDLGAARRAAEAETARLAAVEARAATSGEAAVEAPPKAVSAEGLAA